MSRAIPSPVEGRVEQARQSRAEPTPSDAPKMQRGIQSLETGGTILRALAAAAGPMKLRDLADAVGSDRRSCTPTR